MASSKQRIQQLKEWLEVRKQSGGSSQSSKSTSKFSKADTYNKQRR
jgi:rRNA maturation protein Nop10|tara:strand:- start:207 stop:344 length:138 start_codon:yes stop_codon:yes gene_type:complete